MMLLIDILMFAWLAWLCWRVGRSVVRGAGIQLQGWANWWLSSTMGLAGLSLLVFLVGTFHAFTLPVVCAALACATVGFVGLDILNHWWRTKAEAVSRRGGPGIRARLRQMCSEAPISSAIVLVGSLVAFGGACTPEVRGDPIIYHIAEAKLFVVNHGHTEIRSSALTYIPQHQQLLYALGLLLGDDSLAKMFHWFAGVLLLGGVSSLTLLLGGTARDGVRAAALLVLFPMWLYLATTTYIDLAVGNYLLSGVYCLLLAILALPSTVGENTSWGAGTVFVSGCYFGAATAAKYTAAVVGTVPAVAIALVEAAAALRRGQLRTGRLVRLTVVFALGGGLFFGPWLARNYIWTGNPVAPSLMRMLGPSGVPEATLSWPDIQAGNPDERWPPAHLIASYGHMLASLGDYGNYLPPIVLVLGLVGLAGGTAVRRRYYPRAAALLLLFCALAFLVGVPLGAVRRDSRYVMAHVGIFASLIAFWFGQLPLLLPEREKLLHRLGVTIMAVLVVSCAANSYLKFRDLRETVIPMVSGSVRKSFLRARLQSYDANVALGEVLAGASGKVLGARYPADVDYVLGGMPLTQDLIVQRTNAVTSSSLAGLRRQGVRYLFGSVSDGLAKNLESMGDVHGVPLHRIP